MTLRPVAQALSRPLSSYVLIGLSLACLLGQAAAGWGWSVWWGSGPGLCLIGLAWVWAGRWLAGLTACFVLGFALGHLSLSRVLEPALPPEHVGRLSLPQKTRIEGWLYREPEPLPHRTRLYLQVTRHDDGAAGWLPATGQVLIHVRFAARGWQYGDVVRLPVRLRSPRNFRAPGSFDYAGYLARRGIYTTAFLWNDEKIEKIDTRPETVCGWLEQARRRIGTFFDTRLNSHSATILRALIIGETSGIDKELRKTFARAGVAHVLAISGLHIGLVAGAAYGAWWWLLGRSRRILLTFTMPKLAALLSVPAVFLYTGLAGGRMTVCRALIMVLVYLAAVLLGRSQEVYRSLALAALIVSLVWPGAAFEVSFQLSFVAVLAILVGLDSFRAWWETFSDRRMFQLRPQRGWVFRWLAACGLVSGCATLAVAPITAVHFNTIAIAGLVTNVVVLPLVGVTVVSGLAAAVLVVVHEGLAGPPVFIAGLAVQVVSWVVHAVGTWPWSAFAVVTPNLLELVLAYGIVACLFFVFQPPTPIRSALLRSVLPILCVALLADCAYWSWQRFFRQDLRVTFLDVGQGDAAVVEFPGSHVMVIDGGGFASPTFDSGEAIIAPFLWSRKIGRVDTLVLSHAQLDHYGGLAFVAERFGPREFWSSGQPAKSKRFARLTRALEQAGIVTRKMCRDSPDMVISGVRIAVLHPPCQNTGLNTNNASVVLRLSHGEVNFLLTGDIEATGEKVLLESGQTLHSEIIKVPHHGSRSSSSPAFVAAVAPRAAIASLGLHNRFDFPADEVAQRYHKRGARLLRTDRDGTVLVISDGKGYRLEAPFSTRD